MKYLNIFLITLLASLSLVGCDNDGPMEEAGESVDQAADDAGDATEDAADDVEDTVD
jgi:hypothetical protein